MATVQIPFPARPNPASSPFAHRFSTHHKFPSPPPPSTFSHPYPNQHSAPAASPSRWNSPAKRKHEGEEEYPEQDQAEGQSPRKIAGGKRAKRGPDTVKAHEPERQVTPGGSEVKNEMEDVDIGVLLASVPQSSLLPLLNALIADTPALKPKVISLMPRPSIGSVTAALTSAYQKVQAAYPYSSSAPTFGGFGFGTTFQPAPAPAGGFGFGIGFGSALSSHSTTTQPRDTFARARLRQPVADFVTIVLSYLPYFSLTPVASASHPSASNKQPHAGETFTFLHQAAHYALQLLPLFAAPTPPPADLVDLVNRLLTELAAWSQAVNVHVNKNGGMFGSDMVQAWSRGLDELASLGDEQWTRLRDDWVQHSGWLIGRRVQWRDQDVEL